MPSWWNLRPGTINWTPSFCAQEHTRQSGELTRRTPANVALWEGGSTGLTALQPLDDLGHGLHLLLRPLAVVHAGHHLPDLLQRAMEPLEVLVFRVRHSNQFLHPTHVTRLC